MLEKKLENGPNEKSDATVEVGIMQKKKKVRKILLILNVAKPIKDYEGQTSPNLLNKGNGVENIHSTNAPKVVVVGSKEISIHSPDSMNVVLTVVNK